MISDANVAWADHVPEGWRSLFLELLASITAIDPAVEVTQAKEKFGELRVYLKRFVPEVYQLIDEAARTSRETCQICGKPALLCVKKGLFATLCEEHRGKFTVARSDPILASVRMVDRQVQIVPRPEAQFGGGEDAGEE